MLDSVDDDRDVTLEHLPPFAREWVHVRRDAVPGWPVVDQDEALAAGRGRRLLEPEALARRGMQQLVAGLHGPMVTPA